MQTMKSEHDERLTEEKIKLKTIQVMRKIHFTPVQFVCLKIVRFVSLEKHIFLSKYTVSFRHESILIQFHGLNLFK